MWFDLAARVLWTIIVGWVGFYLGSTHVYGRVLRVIDTVGDASDAE